MPSKYGFGNTRKKSPTYMKSSGFKMKSPLKQNGTKGLESPTNPYPDIEFLKTSYAEGQGVGLRVKPRGKLMATKTKLKAKKKKKKTKHIGDELRKKYGHS